ncbi:MAG: hypothetical protein Q4D55_10020 [Eubacteriales bacterium]|nr:hypothetical protein [Eubacteriales bacterium]
MKKEDGRNKIRPIGENKETSQEERFASAAAKSLPGTAEGWRNGEQDYGL